MEDPEPRKLLDFSLSIFHHVFLIFSLTEAADGI